MLLQVDPKLQSELVPQDKGQLLLILTAQYWSGAGPTADLENPSIWVPRHSL